MILVRWETTPDDIHGMIAAQGILTVHGGMTSHAAVVARGMGKPCVAGLRRRSRSTGGTATIARRTSSREGDVITIDGGTGPRVRRRGAARAAADQRGLRDDPRLGRRAAAPRRARERRQPRGRGAGARVRRGGDRPLPHRAHVLRRRAAAGRAGDDPRRRPRPDAAPRSTGCCRSSSPTSRGSSRRWRGCR